MTYNETITFLKRAGLIDNMIKRKQEEIEELRNLASGMAKMGNSADRVQTSPEHDKIGEIIDKIVDLEHELSLKVERYVDAKKEIIKRIDELESMNQRNVLYMKYLKGRTFEYIAENTGNSLSTIYRLHKKAVKNLSECIDI